MKSLLKVMLILGLIFASTFIIGRALGIFTVENVRYLLETARQVAPLYVIGVVILLLFIDLFVAVPTLTITLLAGYFLGFPVGTATAFTGMTLAAFAGYGISWKFGNKPLNFLVKDATKRQQMISAFTNSGPAMIMLSRAVPILPEVTACMAGVTRMQFWRYLSFYSLGTIPYVTIAAYAGSISTLNNPEPAIFAALGLYALLWVGWFFYRRYKKLQPIA
ncbi:MAG: VTT domain-containing protein [Devosiaceae bacterium]|nr:VTT domain-containing protein [Devosiaceae bacterium]